MYSFFNFKVSEAEISREGIVRVAPLERWSYEGFRKALLIIS